MDPAQNRAPLRARWGCWSHSPPWGKRGSWGEAGAEHIGSSQPELGEENAPNPKCLSVSKRGGSKALGMAGGVASITFRR